MYFSNTIFPQKAAYWSEIDNSPFTSTIFLLQYFRAYVLYSILYLPRL